MLMKTPVDEIYRIKKIREERAERERARAEENLRQKKEVALQKEQELREYQTWRIKEEERQYRELLEKKSVKRKSLDDLKFDIKRMRDKEIDYHQAIEKAEEEVEQAKLELQNAKHIYIQAVRNSEKMSEMQHRLKIELEVDANLKVEKEMEDTFRYKPTSLF